MAVHTNKDIELKKSAVLETFRPILVLDSVFNLPTGELNPRDLVYLQLLAVQ